MPSSRANEWFITLSTRVFEEIDIQKVSSLVSQYPGYHVVKEMGMDQAHPHVHAVVWGEAPESQQAVRKRFCKCVVDPTLRSVVVIPVTDRQKLLTEYLRKDKHSVILLSSLDAATCDSLRASIPESNITRTAIRKRRNVPATLLADSLVDYAREHNLPLPNNPEALEVVCRAMYCQGLRFHHGIRSLKTILCEVKWILNECVFMEASLM